METIQGKVAFVTGASSGIGKACAEHLMRLGCKVYGGSRRVQQEEVVKDAGGGFIRMLKLDVREDDLVNKAVDFVLKEEGRIDILINCAGFILSGAIEDTSVDEAKSVFDTGFFGAQRVCRAVLPAMRKQKNGVIINIGSVAGFVTVPYQVMYSAYKYALEALTEGLRMELRPFGISAALIDPGDTKTGFTSARQWTEASASNPAYRDKCMKAVNSMIKSEQAGVAPDKVAKVVVKVVKRKKPPVRVVVGIDYKATVLLKRLLPSRLVEFIVERLY